MADEITFDADLLLNSVEGLEALRTEVTGYGTGLGADLAAIGPLWTGTDDEGTELFASTYTAYLEVVDAVVAGLGGTLGLSGEQLGEAVKVHLAVESLATTESTWSTKH